MSETEFQGLVPRNQHLFPNVSDSKIISSKVQSNVCALTGREL